MTHSNVLLTSLICVIIGLLIYVKHYFDKRFKHLEQTREFYVNEIKTLQTILQASTKEFNKQLLDFNQWLEDFPGQMNEIFYTDTKVRELKNRFKLADTKMFEHFNPLVESVSKEIIKQGVEVLNRVKARQIDITEKVLNERIKDNPTSRP